MSGHIEIRLHASWVRAPVKHRCQQRNTQALLVFATNRVQFPTGTLNGTRNIMLSEENLLFLPMFMFTPKKQHKGQTKLRERKYPMKPPREPVHHN